MNLFTPRKILVFFSLACPLVTLAQNKAVIEFNQKGQIIYNMPSMLNKGTKLKFVVRGDENARQNKVLSIYLRFMETLKAMEQKDDNQKYKILSNAGLQDNSHANTRLTLVKASIAYQLMEMLHNKDFRPIIQKMHDITADSTKLKSYFPNELLDDVKAFKWIRITDLIEDRYYVNNIFIGGEKAKFRKATECNFQDTLKQEGECCTFHYSSKLEVPFKKYHPNTFFKDSIELRLRNTVFFTMENQLNVFHKEGIFPYSMDYAEKKKAFDKAIKDLIGNDPDNQRLMRYFNSLLTNKPIKNIKDSLNMFHNTPWGLELAKKIYSIGQLYGDTLNNDKNVNFIIDLSWLSRGASLTANPLKMGKAAVGKSDLETKNQELADSTQSLADINQRLTAVENISKSNGVALIGTDDVLRKEGILQSLRKKTTTSITSLKKAVDSLKKVAGKSDNSVQDSKETILSDSLLYAGNLIVNPDNGDEVFSPNNLDYHYMRNHDALQSLNNFDVKTKKDINERQHIDVMLVNTNPKSKYVVKVSFADAPNDVDFFGTNLSNNPGAEARVIPASLTLDQVAKIYLDWARIFTPYTNGVVTYPVLENKDNTPDYRTVTQSLVEPTKVPQIATYTVQDTSVAKSPTYTFTYRYNKLYRFRLKAGIAYSWLERRTYTINTTANTATYTDSYAGLAPSFGFQIFTSRLDIQSTKVFPTGAYPFLYVGYMFHDTPVNNFLLGGGWEIVSGCAITGGIHLGKTQGLTLDQGLLQEKDHYKAAPFLSITIGLEAFEAIFNTTKVTNPFKAP